MRLYLDVDGTLLRRSGHARLRGELAPAYNLLDFLEWAANGFDCVWVTSRTRQGDPAALMNTLRQAVGPGDEWDRIQEAVKTFAAPAWDGHKSQAMDLDQDFVWLDDAPEEESLEALAAAGRGHCWISVNVEQRPDDLRRVMGLIAARHHPQAAE